LISPSATHEHARKTVESTNESRWRAEGIGIRPSASLLRRNPAQHCGQQPVQVLGQEGCGRVRERRVGADNRVDASRELTDAGAHERPQDPFRAVADHRVPHRFGHDKTDPRRLTRARVGEVGMYHDKATARTRSTCCACPLEDCGEIGAAAQTMTRREHASSSGGQFGATLVATSGQDGTARAGAHAKAEAMGLGPTTVVRLEGALAHEFSVTAQPSGGSVLKVVRYTVGRVRCSMRALDPIVRGEDRPQSESCDTRQPAR